MAKKTPATKTTRSEVWKPPEKIVLLSGGNPQIPKGDGDLPVRTYIAAMPDWKRGVGERLDALLAKAVPNLTRSVRWNSPFYGTEGGGYFLSFHCFTRYVKVTFLQGRSLKPMPPGESKDPNTRYLDIHEDEPLDEAQFSDWARQASKLPGWIP